MNLFETKKDKAKKIALEALKNKEAGNLDKAIELLNHAISIDSQNPVYYQNLAYYYDSVNNIDKAIECFEKAFNFDNKNAILACHLGYEYGKKKEYAKSLILHKRAYELKKNDPQIKLLYARALIRCEKYVEAEPIFDQILEAIESNSESIHQYHESVYYEAGAAQLILGNKLKAIQYLEKSLRVWKDDPHSTNLLFQIKHSKSDDEYIPKKY